MREDAQACARVGKWGDDKGPAPYTRHFRTKSQPCPSVPTSPVRSRGSVERNIHQATCVRTLHRPLAGRAGLELAMHTALRLQRSLWRPRGIPIPTRAMGLLGWCVLLLLPATDLPLHTPLARACHHIPFLSPSTRVSPLPRGRTPWHRARDPWGRHATGQGPRGQGAAAGVHEGQSPGGPHPEPGRDGGCGHAGGGAGGAAPGRGLLPPLPSLGNRRRNCGCQGSG